MANNVNPFTGNDNTEALELPSGDLIFIDLDDGLFYGDAQLPPGMNADDLFKKKYGRERPDSYKKHLENLVQIDPNGNTPDLHADVAKDILDGKVQVLTTTLRMRDTRREIGQGPTTQALGATKLHPDLINVSELGAGPGTGKDLQESLDAAADARADAEKASLAARKNAKDKNQAGVDASQDAPATAQGDDAAKTEDAETAPDKTVREKLLEKSDEDLRATAREYSVANADSLSREDLATAILTAAGYSGDALMK